MKKIILSLVAMLSLAAASSQAAVITVYSGFGTTPGTAQPFYNPVGQITGADFANINLINPFGLTQYAVTVTADFIIPVSGGYVVSIYGENPYFDKIDLNTNYGPGPVSGGWQIGWRTNDWGFGAGLHHAELSFIVAPGLPTYPGAGSPFGSTAMAGLQIRGWGGDPNTQNVGRIEFLPDQVSSVPDTGSTFALLAGALVGLGLIRRKG